MKTFNNYSNQKSFFVNVKGNINPFHATGLFLYPLENIGKPLASEVFRRYRKTAVA